MAMQKPEFVRTFPADGAPSTALAANKVVVASTSNAGGVMLPGATTSLQAIGVTTAASDAKGSVTVAMGGIVQVTAGGTITVGALLGFDTSGQAVAITASGSGTTLRGTIGVALSAASSSGLVDVKIQPGYCQV